MRTTIAPRPKVGRPERKRYTSAATKIKRKTQFNTKAWFEFRVACTNFYGSTYGPTVFEWIKRGEHDFAFACEKLLGVTPLAWQVEAWDALIEHRYITAKLANAAGKSTAYSLILLIAGFYRSFSTAEWANAQYRMIHLAPQEDQALEVRTKMSEILSGTSPAQMYRVPGGHDYRPCLLTPFISPEKQDGGQHEGFNFLDGSAVLTFRASAFKAKGIDGTPPALVTYDELRHERNFDHVLNAIIMPRFLRVPFGRLLMFFTPLEASVELITAYNRGLSDDPADVDWYSISISDLREANPGISDETIDRANRNIAKRFLPMVTGGKTIQPAGSKFSQESVDRATIGNREADWLSDMPGILKRVRSRCVTCQRIDAGDQDARHIIGDDPTLRKHPMVSFVDPASSSAGADSIVAVSWDCQPPNFPTRWAECVYIEELPVGTKIQRVGAHVAILSMVTHGVCGWDQNSALGYAVNDNVTEFGNREQIMESPFVEPELKAALEDVPLMDEPDIAPVEHNTKKEKDNDLDYLNALLDLEKIGIHYHLQTKIQMTNYVRKDTGIRQDYVMAQAGAAFLAKFILPDMYVERTARQRGGVKPGKSGGHDDVFLGLGGEPDNYFAVPGELNIAYGEFGEGS